MLYCPFSDGTPGTAYRPTSNGRSRCCRRSRGAGRSALRGSPRRALPATAPPPRLRVSASPPPGPAACRPRPTARSRPCPRHLSLHLRRLGQSTSLTASHPATIKIAFLRLPSFLFEPRCTYGPEVSLCRLSKLAYHLRSLCTANNIYARDANPAASGCLPSVPRRRCYPEYLLTLNNNNAASEIVNLTLYMPDGQSIILPDFSLEADESKLIHLDRLLLSKNIAGTLGYLKISYAGKLMATGAQLTLYPLAGMGGLDSARSLTVDFTNTHRTAVAWFPPHSTATVALSNVSASLITVTSRIIG